MALSVTDHLSSLLHERLHLHQLFMLLEPFPERLLVCRPVVLSLHEKPGELACGWQGRRRRGCRPPLGRAMGMEPFGHQRARAREALLPDLAPQTGLIHTTLRATGVEVGNIRINFSCAP